MANNSFGGNVNPQNHYFVSSYHTHQQQQQQPVIFSPLPPSAVSAAAFVPRSYIAQVPQQPIQPNIVANNVNNGQYYVSS